MKFAFVENEERFFGYLSAQIHLKPEDRICIPLDLLEQVHFNVLQSEF